MNNREAIEFLKNLGAEMKEQDTDGQATPRFWVVAQNKREYGFASGYTDGEVVINTERDEYDNVNEFILFLIENDYLDESDIDEEREYDFDEILEMVNDSDFYICGYRDIHNSICENTMFITKAECKKHIELNDYHYENPHTYAMTAWRSPQVEKLYDVSMNTDWSKVEMALVALEQREQELCKSCEWREFPPCPAEVVGGKCSFESRESTATEQQDEMKQGCNICNSDEIEKLLIMKDRNTEYLAFVGGNSKFPKKNHAKFCPECGRKLEG